MKDELTTRIEKIDPSILHPLIQNDLRAKVRHIGPWQCEQIHGGTFGIVYRFRGEAQTDNGNLPWSLILKVVRNTPDAPVGRTEPTSLRYWKREPLVFQSGFLAHLSGNLVAPRCFDIVNQASDECWLWLEDVAESSPQPWEWERFGLAARHLGQFSGQYVHHNTLLASPWLGRKILRTQAEEAKSNFGQHLSALSQDAIGQRFIPPDVAHGLEQLWQEQNAFIECSEQLPQTICHLDAFRGNLFSRQQRDGTQQTVAIDWEFTAQGAIGEELVTLVIVSLLQGAISLDDSQDFDRYAFACYQTGLQESGWQDNSTLARLGYTTAYIRYAFGLLPFISDLALHPKPPLAQSQKTGQTNMETAAHWAAILRFVLMRLEEARQLM